MESFRRLKNPLVLLALVLVQTLWLAVQVQRPVRPAFAMGSPEDSHKVTLLRSWSMFFMGPLEHAAEAAGAGVRHGWANYLDLRHIREQDKGLRAEVARLRQEQASFAEDAAEGRRLQRLLAFKQQYIASTVAAEVIGTSGSDRSHVLWIDKGSDDGLKPEQAVVTPDGVVGKLRDVMPHTAQLLLLNDSSSGAGVFLASTRMRGILRGTAAGDVVINNLTPDDRIKPGEHVITSGGDQVFPPGMPVGTIVSVAPDPTHPPYTVIRIRPAANLHQLEEVLVITGTTDSMPPNMQADAAEAAALAADNRRAADVIAERLPSVPGTDQGASGATGSPGAAGATGTTGSTGTTGAAAPGAVARPALHPDRYSPGAAPPAADMTPGAAAPAGTQP